MLYMLSLFHFHCNSHLIHVHVCSFQGLPFPLYTTHDRLWRKKERINVRPERKACLPLPHVYSFFLPSSPSRLFFPPAFLSLAFILSSCLPLPRVYSFLLPSSPSRLFFLPAFLSLAFILSSCLPLPHVYSSFSSIINHELERKAWERGYVYVIINSAAKLPNSAKICNLASTVIFGGI